LLEPGDTVEHDGALFKVERVERRRIRRIRFTPPPETKPATNDATPLTALLPFIGTAAIVARASLEWSAQAHALYS
jgi:hypothetical protein